jgi:hypothetical protein
VRQILVAAYLILSGGIILTFGNEGTGSTQDELYEELSVGLAKSEAMVADIALQDGASPTLEQMEALKSLNRQIRGSLYSDLMDRSELLLLLAQEQVRIHQDPQDRQARLDQVLQDSRQAAENRSRSDSRAKILRTSFTTTMASFALAFTFWGLGELQDLRYFESPTIEEARLHRRLFQVFSIGSLIGASIGLVSAGVTVTLYVGAR